MRSKTLLLLLVSAIAGISGFLIKVPKIPTIQPTFVPRGWIHLQKLILPLFENVCEESTYPIIVRMAQEFDLGPSTEAYLNPEVIQNFLTLRSKGLLTKGEIFTEYNPEHINEFRVLYELLVNAKDFDTFYKAAAWTRQNVNCGLFVDLIYMAVLNRRDTEKLSVPAPYELLPNYFITKDIIVKASTLLSESDVTSVQDIKEDGNSYIIDSNYTSTIDEFGDLKLAYFREDIGLNTFYFLQKLKKAPWFNTPPSTSIRYGEYLYHTMKQLSTRYDLERYANNLPELDDDLDLSNVTPYDPMLVYSNGNEFGYRTTLGKDSSDISTLNTIENNLGTIVSHMLTSGYNKTQILNHLMEVLVTGEKSYETLARKCIGKDFASNSFPSTLEHYVTSLRDPAFWYINKKIVSLVDNALQNLPEYKRNELLFPGVEVVNIDVKKLSTFFDNFQFDVTDALKTGTSEPTFQVKIGQPRLNHKPFAFKLNVTSLASQKGLVKIYIGPKVSPGEYNIKKNQFMLLDSFECDLKLGTNVISRSSDQMENLSDDFTFLKVLRKQVEDADFGLDVVPLKSIVTLTSFPNRLILPKGTPEGLPLQIFVFIAPFVKASMGGIYGLSTAQFNTAVLSPGYPFDLPCESNIFVLPNALVKDFTITHKGDSKTGNYGGQPGASKWQNDYDPASRPDYSAKTKQPFDYTLKKSFDYKMKKDQINKDTQINEESVTEIIKTVVPVHEKVNNIALPTETSNVESMETNILDDLMTPKYRILQLTPLDPGYSMKRTPTVYDYLMPHYVDHDDEYDDDRVYE